MKDIKVYKCTNAFFLYDEYIPKGTKVIVDHKNYCIVPEYIMPFEMLKEGKFEEITIDDIEEMTMNG